MPEIPASEAQNRFLRFPVGKRLLSVAAEMQRAVHWLENGDGGEVKRCYARALELMDWTCVPADIPARGMREYRRWREELARLYAQDSPEPGNHHLLAATLLTLHPDGWNAFHPHRMPP